MDVLFASSILLRTDRDDVAPSSVQILVEHPAMRRVICDILGEAFGIEMVLTELEENGEGADGVEPHEPDIVLTDGRAFFEQAPPLTRSAVVVIGPDADPSYREAALRAGADSWLRPDHLVDDLAPELRRILARSPRGHHRHP